jgi:hypothetical protein
MPQGSGLFESADEPAWLSEIGFGGLGRIRGCLLTLR